MYPDQNFTCSVDSLTRVYVAWVKYISARKRRGDLLRVVTKALNRVLRDATAVGIPLRASCSTRLEIFFEPSVPVYSIMSYD